MRGFALAQNKNVCSMRANCGGTERRARTPAAMRRIRSRMSMGNGTSPSPGPPASRTRPRGPLSAQGEGLLTEILCGENEKAKAAALLPYRRIGVLEGAGLCFHQHSRVVRWFLNPRATRWTLCPPRAFETPQDRLCASRQRCRSGGLRSTPPPSRRLKIVGTNSKIYCKDRG